MNHEIYPLAYALTPGQTCTLYYLSFPERWKITLLDIAKKNSSRFKDGYGLPTNALKKLVVSWMNGVISLASLKKDSNDEHWLTSCAPYSEKDIQVLCNLIKVWVKACYVSNPKASPFVKQLANKFCDEIKAEELIRLQSSSEVCLTYDDGTVSEEAYAAVPLLVINRLLGQEILLNGQPLHLCYVTKNQLMSQPIAAMECQHQYSFVFDFSVQTTPPQRKAMLLCQMSIRRWVPGCFVTDGELKLKENVNAHIKISADKYCKVPIGYNWTTKRIHWSEQDKECYNIWGYQPLPPAEDVMRNPAAYAEQIMLPYKYGMWGMKESYIGTGVPVVDKVALHHAISTLLGELVCNPSAAKRATLRGQKITCHKSPQGYGTREEFRQWVRKCAETGQITFEIYGLWKDPEQKKLLEQIQNKIEQDFGPNEENSCLRIHCVQKEVGSLADGMENSNTDTQIKRCDEIVDTLRMADGVTACIFVLPGEKKYAQSESPKGDPKQALRNAFARTGRVVQFITPETDGKFDKISNAVYDLYRQLGVVALPNLQEKMPPMANVPCVGMYLYTQVHGRANKGRFLPVSIAVNVLEGKTRVHCDAFANPTVSYREACLEMAQLFWKQDLEKRCVEASRTPAKRALIGLKNRHYERENPVLVVVEADGNMRTVWNGISDKEIGGYVATEQYCPEEINVGMPQNPYMISLADSGVRIVRIRSNQEVPDYYTGLAKTASKEQPQYSSASGMFRYEDVYWGIHERVYDFQYVNSYKQSRIDHPEQRFAEKDMVEMYPLQLQRGDEAVRWIAYTNALRGVSIQYKQSTVLPLPLHLAEVMKEYLFDV